MTKKKFVFGVITTLGLCFGALFFCMSPMEAQEDGAGGKWDWRKKQIHQLNAYQIKPPESVGSGFNTIKIGQNSKVTEFLGKIKVGNGTPGVTQGDEDLYVEGDLEVDGGIYPATRGFIPFDLAGAVVDSSNDIDDATAPNITIADNIPVVLWDASKETTGILYTFAVPPDYSSGLRLHALVSSNTANGAPAIDWRLWFNKTSTGFDTSASEETGAAASIAAINSSNEVLTMTISAGSDTQMAAGTFVTLEVFNASTHLTANTELKGLYADYLRKM